jgi:hypothetical protein
MGALKHAITNNAGNLTKPLAPCRPTVRSGTWFSLVRDDGDERVYRMNGRASAKYLAARHAYFLTGELAETTEVAEKLARSWEAFEHGIARHMEATFAHVEFSQGKRDKQTVYVRVGG